MTQQPTNPEPSADFVLLNDLLDGRLDDADADAVRARIDTESPMREMWDELKRMQDCVRGYGPTGEALEPPTDFVAQVRRRIDTPGAEAAPTVEVPSSVPVSAPRPRGRVLRMFTLAYAAAALLVVGFTVHYALNRSDVESGSTLETADTPDDMGPPETATFEARSRETTEDLEDLEETAFLQDKRGREGEARSAPAAGSLDKGGKQTGAKPKAPGARDELAGRAKEKTASGDKPPVGGGFRGPGGAVPPGMRKPSDEVQPTPTRRRPRPGESPTPTPTPRPTATPSDLPPPDPMPPPDPVPPPLTQPVPEPSPEPVPVDPPARDPAPEGEDAEEDERAQPAKEAGKREAPTARDILLVYHADDVARAPTHLRELLAKVSLRLEPADPTPPPPSPTTPVPPSGTPPPPSSPPADPRAPATTAARLYRLTGPLSELRRLDSSTGIGGGAGGTFAETAGRKADSVVETLDAKSWQRLAGMIGGRTWPPAPAAKKSKRLPENKPDAGSARPGTPRPSRGSATGGRTDAGKPVRVRIVIVPAK